MGARWEWSAVCVNGHEFGGFSGGSDGICDVCESAITEEWPKFWYKEDDERVDTEIKHLKMKLILAIEALERAADQSMGMTHDMINQAINRIKRRD